MRDDSLNRRITVLINSIIKTASSVYHGLSLHEIQSTSSNMSRSPVLCAPSPFNTLLPLSGLDTPYRQLLLDLLRHGGQDADSIFYPPTVLL